MFFPRASTILLMLLMATIAWSSGHGHSSGDMKHSKSMDHAGEVSSGDIVVMHPWSRAVPVAGMNAAGYMKIMNKGDKAVTLTQFVSSASAKTSLHETVKKGDMASMRALPEGITIPAKGNISLQPGGLHLMLLKIKAPLVEGDEIPVTLKFDSGIELAAKLMVKPIGTTDGHDKMHH